MNWNVVALLLVAFLAANLPFVSRKLFGVVTLARAKHAGWQALELLVMFGVVAVLAYGLEARQSAVHPQNWQFYVTNLALCLVFAFPGFVGRHFWHRRGMRLG